MWIPQKPPSADVAKLLESHGIGPKEAYEDDSDEQPHVPGWIGTGVMADIARHLEVAHRSGDLELLGSLLHPEVERDAVILGLSVSRTPEGARPVPAQLVYQTVTVADAQVVSIRGYPDRASALARFL